MNKIQEQYSNKLFDIFPEVLATNSIERVHPFIGITGDKSYINDIRIDTVGQIGYLTNSNEGGIIVLDLQTGQGRQLLQNHYSVRSDPDFTIVIDGHELKKEGEPVKMQSDGIALSPDGFGQLIITQNNCILFHNCLFTKNCDTEHMYIK